MEITNRSNDVIFKNSILFCFFLFVLIFIFFFFACLLDMIDVNIFILESFVLMLISLLLACVNVWLDLCLILNVKFCFLCRNKKTALFNNKMEVESSLKFELNSMFFVNVNKWDNMFVNKKIFEMGIVFITYIWCKIYLRGMMVMNIVFYNYNYNVCCKFINMMSKIMRYFIDNG